MLALFGTRKASLEAVDPGDVNQGSILSSDNSNVKLESGTLMLQRVNP